MEWELIERLCSMTDEKVAASGAEEELQRVLNKPSNYTWREWAWELRGFSLCSKCGTTYPKSKWCSCAIPPRTGLNKSLSAYEKARKKNRIPPEANMKRIEFLYSITPSGFCVDHIVPYSKGGLHEESNLQILSATESKQKGNSLDWCPSKEYPYYITMEWTAKDILTQWKNGATGFRL